MTPIYHLITYDNLRETVDILLKIINDNNNGSNNLINTGISAIYQYIDNEVTKVDTKLIQHVNDSNNPHKVTHLQVGSPSIVQFNEHVTNFNGYTISLQNHVGNNNNPHKVTLSQILGNTDMSDESGGVVPIVAGGTGANTAALARANLQITPANIGAATTVQGTNADNAVRFNAPQTLTTAQQEQARSNIGATDYSHPTHTARNTPLTNGSVYNNIVVNNQGHITDLITRVLSAADVAAIPLNDIAAATGGILPPVRGGTGQVSLQATRNAMGLGNTTGVLPAANGGTGHNSLTAALLALPNI